MISYFVPLILAGVSGPPGANSGRSSGTAPSHLDATAADMVQRTADRLRTLAAPDAMYVVGDECTLKLVQQRMPQLSADHLLCEPVPRNTAPASGLVAFLLARTHPDAVLGVFPMDHEVTDVKLFVSLLREGVEMARTPDRIVMLGVPAARPSTCHGYIEMATPWRQTAQTVQSFKEKPDAVTAAALLSSGRYLWNSGIYLWTARTLCQAIREHAPAMAVALDAVAEARGTPHFQTVLHAIYHSCDNISIDRALLEPRSALEARSGICCLPADFGWSDTGCAAPSTRRAAEYVEEDAEPSTCEIDQASHYV